MIASTRTPKWLKRPDHEYDGLTYRERAEIDLAHVSREYTNWWLPLATAGVWALLAIARALEQMAWKDEG